MHIVSKFIHSQHNMPNFTSFVGPAIVRPNNHKFPQTIPSCTEEMQVFTPTTCYLRFCCRPCICAHVNIPERFVYAIGNPIIIMRIKNTL